MYNFLISYLKQFNSDRALVIEIFLIKTTDIVLVNYIAVKWNYLLPKTYLISGELGTFGKTLISGGCDGSL